MPKSPYPFGPMSIDEVLYVAKDRAKLATLDALAERIGVAASTVYQWRSRKRLPSDDVMLVLGTMAGLYPLEALLLLNVWRNDGHAVGVYIRSLKRHGFHYIHPVTHEIAFSGPPRKAEDELDDGLPIWVKPEQEQIATQ